MISYLFTSRYFKQDDVVKMPVENIISEVDIYSDNDTLFIYPLKQCLKEIRIVIDQSYYVLESESIPYWLLEALNDIKKADVDQALNSCFRHLHKLTGMAKLAGLLYQSKRFIQQGFRI